MNTIFEPFDTKEDLMNFVDGAVSENEEGKFLLGEAVDKYKKYGELVEENKRYRGRAQDVEKERDALKTDIEALQREKILLEDKINQYGTLQGTNEDLTQRYKESLDRESDLKKELDAAYAELTPLKEEIGTLRRNEERRVIQSELYEEAKRQKVRPEAFQDINLLVDEFGIDPVTKQVRTKNGDKRVQDYMSEFLNGHRYWLIPSVGTGSDSGNGRGNNSREAQYNNAKNNRDYTSMVKNAPIIR